MDTLRPTPVHPFEVGLYGKLPTHGDFLRRRVSDGFVGVWDGWLQDCLAASRDALAGQWLDVYLTSPVWRFACAAGACGPVPVAGVMVPSVDRVGRYFPLTLVASLPRDADLLALPTVAASFYERAEALAVDALAADHLDFHDFDAQVTALSAQLDALPVRPVALDSEADAILTGDNGARWQLPIGSAPQLQAAWQYLCGRRLSAIYHPLVLWWTSGSSMVDPSCLIERGLPHPESFAALLDGGWTARRWRSVPVQLAVADAPESLIDDATAPSFRCAAESHVGRVRKINQDAFIDRTDVGIWAVADGVGGHSQGEVASRMVCDAIADVVPGATLGDVLTTVRQQLDRVNAYLVRQAADDERRRSGSTVVVLLTRASRCMVVWAGDSRVYRLRASRLEQLTRDHSVAESPESDADVESHAITRAIGGEATLELEVFEDRVLPGDRFLLCSDGLTREVPEDQIRAFVSGPDIRAGVDRLIQAALDGGGRDNVTALIVEAVA
jgi:type VI secretion system protein ImpM